MGGGFRNRRGLALRSLSVLLAASAMATARSSTPAPSPATAAATAADADVAPMAARGVVACVRLDGADVVATSGADAVGPPPREPASGGILPRALAARLSALGVRGWRALLDGLPRAATISMARAAARRSAAATPPATEPSENPFDLDPSRIWCFEAADSAAAARLSGALAGDPAVEWVEPLVTRVATRDVVLAQDPIGRSAAPGASLPPGFPNDPLFRDGRQWGLDNRGNGGVYGGVAGADVRALAAWRLTGGASGVRLAVADTGLDPAHPEFAPGDDGAPRVIDGWNATTEPGGAWSDSAAHGTMVTGVFAARSGDGAHFDSLGIAGVCGGDGGAHGGCAIVPIKIAPGHATTASSFDIARAIVYAVACGARALNLSFAGGGPSRLEREALYYAMTRGCLVVAAAGNRGASTPTLPQYPAAYAADGLCLQIGASDPWDRRAVFSSYGPGLDVLAPGVDVWTTFTTYPSAAGASYPGYAAVSGTSLAAPFATGTAGLLFATRPELAADDARALIRRGARDVGPPGADAESGMGVLDAAAALALVPSDAGVWHDEVAADTFACGPTDTLRVLDSGPGAMLAVATWPMARRVEVRATVAIPDSFVDSVAVWPRAGGTMAVRGDFQLPYFAPFAEVVARSARAFTLRGFVYEALDPAGEPIGIPLPADQARFGFTVVGRVRRPALAAAPSVPAVVLVAPNPFRDAVRIEVAPGADVGVFDVRGRRVRRWLVATRAITWDGRAADGRPAPPGLYWVRARGRGAEACARVVKLE